MAEDDKERISEEKVVTSRSLLGIPGVKIEEIDTIKAVPREEEEIFVARERKADKESDIEKLKCSCTEKSNSFAVDGEVAWKKERGEKSIEDEAGEVPISASMI